MRRDVGQVLDERDPDGSRRTQRLVDRAGLARPEPRPERGTRRPSSSAPTSDGHLVDDVGEGDLGRRRHDGRGRGRRRSPSGAASGADARRTNRPLASRTGPDRRAASTTTGSSREGTSGAGAAP